MADQKISRKLAVIVHADVVSSTALVRRNETLAHERIRDAFNRFSKTIEAYGGTPHELRGDALVAEFGRAEVPIKGTPADKFVRKMQQVVAMVTRSGHHSLRLRVTFEFDPSVECDEYPQ